MSRSVFLSSGGDPFLLLFVHKLFRERWYDEVDEFMVDINNHCGVPASVLAEAMKLLATDPKVHIIYHPTGIGNGLPITEMTLLSKREHILLLEDDGFIFNSGIVDTCFRLIETGQTDLVGSPRGSCGEEIWEASKKKYHLDYTGYGDVGPNFWPNFFFCKRSDLLRTDMNFGSKEFTAGTYVPELDHIFTETQYGDTFVWACIQLRHLGVKVAYIPQHKADPYEIENRQQLLQNWHESQKPFDWIHGGSLSSGWGGYLSGKVPEATNDAAKREMESRCAFWFIVSDSIDALFDFKVQYRKGIYDLIKNYGLDMDNITQKIVVYKGLLRL